MKQYVNQKTLMMVYYAYFHEIMNYGIIFWGNSPHSVNIFCLQKKVIRIITWARNRDSRRDLFKILKILCLQSQYIYSLLCFITNNMDQYQLISDIHSRNTRWGSNFYQPSSNLSLYQRGTYYTGIKIFNSLPPYLKKLHNDSRLFILALKDYLYTHSFYTLQENYNLDNN
jgi:hypothetical protein